MPICVNHGIPYRAMSLNSYFSLSDVDIRIDAKDVLAVEGLTWLINTIISVLVGLLCGGGGIAILSSGISGIVAGTILSLLILLLGKQKMQSLFMNMDIPGPMRRIVPRGHFENRLGRMADEIKTGFLRSLEGDKSGELAGRLTGEISEQIEQCLSRMAEIVEIPL